ncbi:MAG: hypothetical protein R3B90_04660 [Planctomycetaceae bacterium]
MTDDVDGPYIRTLLLTFMFRHMRELVKLLAAFMSLSPAVQGAAEERKNAKPRYVQTHQEMMAGCLNAVWSRLAWRSMPATVSFARMWVMIRRRRPPPKC